MHTGEHYVSKCVFDTDRVSVCSFGWCKEAPKEIPVKTLTANILCATHNNALFPVDEAAV
jgi:hypothetical protein